MLSNGLKKVPFWCLLLVATPIFAEGIVDVTPYISTSVNYDDNVFRFSSPTQAQAAFGSSETADLVKRIDFGANANLRLSRQLVTLSANINESKYNRFDLLDNTGNSYGLGWNWRLGNDFYGVLNTSKSEGIAGFNEVRSPVKNTRTSTRKSASINWSLQPDWTLHATGEHTETENELSSFISQDRKDEVFETGVRYQNTLATQLGLSYRINESSYPNREGATQFFFGNESKLESIIATAAWQPSQKTRISTRLSQVSIAYKDKSQRDFSGFSQRWIVDYALSGKVNVGVSAYKEVSPIEDIESNYVQATGANFNSSWNITSKVALRGGLGFEERDYLGNTGFLTANSSDRDDESITANLSLQYLPTARSLVQLQYQGEKRTSSIDSQSYQFNNINFTLRYDF